jgi:hypothetical protein
MFEKAKSRKEQEKRLTDDMSGEVTFEPQCKGCQYNVKLSECEPIGIKPAEIISGEKICDFKEELK